MNKFFKGFYYAWKGLTYTFQTQINFRVQIGSALFTTGLSFYLQINTAEWLWILSAIALVLIAELANTAIETLVDLISPEFNPKAGIIKDISAAVALLSAVLALVIGLLILLPKLLHAS